MSESGKPACLGDLHSRWSRLSIVSREYLEARDEFAAALQAVGPTLIGQRVYFAIEMGSDKHLVIDWSPQSLYQGRITGLASDPWPLPPKPFVPPVGSLVLHRDDAGWHAQEVGAVDGGRLCGGMKAGEAKAMVGRFVDRVEPKRRTDSIESLWFLASELRPDHPDRGWLVKLISNALYMARIRCRGHAVPWDIDLKGVDCSGWPCVDAKNVSVFYREDQDVPDRVTWHEAIEGTAGKWHVATVARYPFPGVEAGDKINGD